MKALLLVAHGSRRVSSNTGATSIVVLPYFLNSGRHFVEDIPEILTAEKESYPDVSITI